MSDNEITGWTNFASAVPNLTNLDLSNNAISDLALIGGIETLTKLETLNVSNNQLTTIPDLKALTSLTSLDLTGNDGLVASTIAGNLPTSITSQEGWEEDVLGEPSTTPGSKEARIEDVEYDTLEEAVAAANEKGNCTIELLDNADCGSTELQITAENVAINGNGHTLTSNSKRAITFTADGGSVTGLTINASGHYGVQFYRCKGKLSGVTINGGDWYSVLVNGATVDISNCDLNSNGWAGIDFSANSTAHLPKLTISSTNSGEKSLVLLDDGTMKTLADAYNITETDPTKKANEILEKLKDNNILPSSVTDDLQVKNGQLVTKVPDQPSDDNPSSSSGSSSSRKKPERLLAGWDSILSRALHADPEDTLSFDMTGEKYVPASLIEALQESGAALELEYRGTVYTITGDSVEVDSGRIYWPVADFLDLLRDAPAAAEEEAPAEDGEDVSTANPDTGAHDGVGLAVALAALSLAAAGVVSLRK